MANAKQKTLGVIGGMSWESTTTYYQQLNQGMASRLGGLHSAELVLASVDFGPISELQHCGNWAALSQVLANKASSLQRAGVDAVVLATNTMHKLASSIENAIDVPFLHILDALAKRCERENISTIGLLGTRFTMEDGFYQDLMRAKGIETLVPERQARDEVHRVIYEELCRGVCSQEAKTYYLKQIEQLADNGAQAVVLGCTEIGLLVNQRDTAVALLDTTSIHVEYCIEHMLAD